MEVKKKEYIEFLRIAACFLVIVNHTNSIIFLTTAPSPVWFASLTYFFICKIAVPLFLMIMGSLLLEKQDSLEKSVQRLLRILLALLISSALCYLYYGYAGGSMDQLSISEFFHSILTSSMTNAFWYLYLYLGLLCLLPLFQKMASVFGRRELCWLLFLTLGIMGTAPILTVFFPAYFLHPDFTAPLLSPYIGAVFLGLYIERYIPNTRKTFFASCGLFLFLIAFQVLATFHLYQLDPSFYLQLDDRSLSPSVCSAACLYLMIKYIFTHVRFPSWFLRGVRFLGSLTFGIYLVSDLAIAHTGSIYLRLIQQTPVMLAMVLWELAIFLACALVTVVLKKLPGLRKLL